ncbi:MAG: hypothetical protein JRE40_15285 [Deltaproteobacteria bacterium]|nr:hypothetical protein [Deltaproteobacteria bacterium]
MVPIVAGEVAGGFAAAAVTANPAAALATSSAVSGAINALSVPLRDKILRDMYGFTQEEIDTYSDPNEALIQGAIASGAELGFGAFIGGVRRVRNRKGKRFLDVEDYDDIVANNNEIRMLFDKFEHVTGISGSAPSNELIAAASGVRAVNQSGSRLAIGARTVLARLGMTAANREVARGLTTRLKVASGFAELTNRNVLDASDPEQIAINLTKQRGVLSPDDKVDPAYRALMGRELLEEDAGIPTARARLLDAELSEEEALNIINNRSNPRRFVDVQEIGEANVRQSMRDEGEAWNAFRKTLEVNGKSEAGIVLNNKAGNTAIKRSLNRISAEGQAALSTSLAAKGQKMVDDLAALRNDTLDINSLHRLKSQLLLEKRGLDRNPNSLGYNATDLQRVVDAIDGQLQRADWVRGTTGKKVPAVKARGLEQYAIANDATKYRKTVTQKDTVSKLLGTETTYDPVTKKAVGLRFNNMPSSVRHKMLSDPEVMRDMLDVVGHNPKIKLGMAAELEAVYRRTVYANGKYSPGAAQEFRRNFGDHMDIVFGPENSARIHNVETFSAATENRRAILNQVEDMFDDTYGQLYKRGTHEPNPD